MENIYIFAQQICCVMRFNDNRNLEPSVHYMTLDELTKEFGFSERRKELIHCISEVANILKDVGCSTLYVDGSFASLKLEPNDWDGCYECCGDANTFLQKILDKEPSLLYRDKQQEKYQCDLFPSWFTETGCGKTFLEFFQQTRDGEPKGIIAIKLNER